MKIEAWYDMLMRGKRKPIYIPIHRYPFTLVRICLYKADGTLAYPQALWVIVMGEQRSTLNPVDIFIAYDQRYDLEHFFRFGKQRLLLAGFQTPEVEHEENWWTLAHLLICNYGSPVPMPKTTRALGNARALPRKPSRFPQPASNAISDELLARWEHPSHCPNAGAIPQVARKASL